MVDGIRSYLRARRRIGLGSPYVRTAYYAFGSWQWDLAVAVISTIAFSMGVLVLAKGPGRLAIVGMCALFGMVFGLFLVSDKRRRGAYEWCRVAMDDGTPRAVLRPFLSYLPPSSVLLLAAILSASVVFGAIVLSSPRLLGIHGALGLPLIRWAIKQIHDRRLLQRRRSRLASDSETLHARR